MFMLAKRFENDATPDGWWLSEKFDGWRAMWTGTDFVTRGGTVLPAPGQWRCRMPSVPLDGELWLGRGRFREMNQAIKCSDWSALSFRVFDMPQDRVVFEDRIAALARLELPDFIRPVEHVVCTGVSHLREFFNGIVAAGGEGVMLRAARSRYDDFRSPRLLKLKPVGVD